MFENPHPPQRPTWDCLGCGKPWPCVPAREDLTQTLDPVMLGVYMNAHLGIAAADLPSAQPGELFTRFIEWTGTGGIESDRWKLTRQAVEAGEPEPTDDEDFPLGFTLLDLFAALPATGITEVRDGVYLAGEREGALRLLAQHDEFRRRMMGDGA